jgi:hypothetical protein
MSENISVTRIVDLPEGPYMGGGIQNVQNVRKGVDNSGFSNTYLPMDIHPNPYGMPPPPPGGILPPQHTEGRTLTEKYVPEVQQRLPQRDIPMNISEHIQDDHIQPNYIPPVPKLTSDYIQEYQTTQERKIREYEEKKNREKVREHWLEEFQMPILVALLYFVFQLPIVNTLLFKRFSFMSIYRDDGNFNWIGITLKSVLFAVIYFFIHFLNLFFQSF